MQFFRRPYAYVGNSPTGWTDPLGWFPKGKDKWYGYNDPHFHKWFHRCWKQPGDPDASKEEIKEAYDEWVSRGKPQNGNCWNRPQNSCRQKTMFEIQQEENSARYMQNFWTDILIGDVALGVVGTAGALGWMELGAAGGGAIPPARPITPEPRPMPEPKPAPAPIPVKPAA